MPPLAPAADQRATAADWRLVLLALALLLVAVSSRAWTVAGRAKAVPSGPGVAVGYGVAPDALDRIGPVWYMDYGFAGRTRPGHQRLFFAGLRDPLKDVAQAARLNPGEWWTFGNEPNDPNQDNISPEAYVRPYHDFYFALKRADPQARVVPTGVANADWPWLDAWRSAYRSVYGRYPSVDGWRFHNYLLDTCTGAMNAAEFERRAVEFREWTRRIGDGKLPILLTEYGVLYGNGCCNCPRFAEADLIAYMRATTRWLKASDTVTGWMWFSLDSENRFNGDLFHRGEILPAGEAYRDLVNESRGK